MKYYYVRFRTNIFSAAQFSDQTRNKNRLFTFHQAPLCSFPSCTLSLWATGFFITDLGRNKITSVFHVYGGNKLKLQLTINFTYICLLTEIYHADSPVHKIMNARVVTMMIDNQAYVCIIFGYVMLVRNK